MLRRKKMKRKIRIKQEQYFISNLLRLYGSKVQNNNIEVGTKMSFNDVICDGETKIIYYISYSTSTMRK